MLEFLFYDISAHMLEFTSGRILEWLGGDWDSHMGMFLTHFLWILGQKKLIDPQSFPSIDMLKRVRG